MLNDKLGIQNQTELAKLEEKMRKAKQLYDLGNIDNKKITYILNE